MPRLQQVVLQWAASLVAAPPNLHLIDENLRGYVLLLSAHFQGYCRDLHTECAQIAVSKVRAALRALMQTQFLTERKLDHGNPSLDNLRKDFERFGFSLDVTGADPASPPRSTQLAELIKSR